MESVKRESLSYAYIRRLRRTMYGPPQSRQNPMTHVTIRWWQPEIDDRGGVYRMSHSRDKPMYIMNPMHKGYV